MLASTSSTAAQTIAPKPAVMPPAAQPALPAGGSAGGPSFAQFLNDQPVVMPPPPEHADPVPREPESASPEAKAAQAAAPARRQAAPAKQVPKSTSDAAAKPEPTATAKSGDATDDKGDVAATDKSQDPETAGLDEFTQLIGLTPQALPAPTAPVAALAAAAPGADATQDDAPAIRHGRGRINRAAEDEGAPTTARTGADTTTAAASERRPAEAPGRDSAPRAKGADLAAAADKAAARSATSSETLQTSASASASASTPQAAAASATPPASFAAVLAQAMPITVAAADAAPVSASGQVHAALHSSAFAPELGARVSLLAVDGVQQAELQLNPADMGPVAVQIVVDGAQAQVSFHAVQAETRQALEQSLPDLAAALQSQGLTLSGGGVFQQAPRDAQGGETESGSDDGRGSRSGGASARVGGSASITPPAVRRSVGLLDTFA